MAAVGRPLALLLLACLALTAAAARRSPQYWGKPIAEFAAEGADLTKLPGSRVLFPKRITRDLHLTLTPATIQGPSGADDMLHFNNGVYRDGRTGTFNIFGPGLRIRAGDSFSITVANNLTKPGPDAPANMENGFHNPADTNCHTHGLHASPGAVSQETAKTYAGGDNVYVTVPGKARDGAKPKSVKFTGTVRGDHMPGMHWYHPHHHGSGTIQAFTAAGAIVVEDDPAWLPDAGGCAPVREALAAAPDVMLHFEQMSFAPIDPESVAESGSVTIANRDDANPQFYGEDAAPHSNLCCNSTGLSGTMKDSDFLLVNGGYKPTLKLPNGRWQRWRALNTGYRRLLEFMIVDAASMKPTDKCQMQLLSKDGLYLMQIPRQVKNIYLAPANRAELLVKCDAAVGDKFVLTSGAPGISPFGVDIANVLVQDVALTLEITAPGGPASAALAQRACTPLRPSYAADLSDASLKAAGALAGLKTLKAEFTFDQPFGCQVNGQSWTFPDPAPLVFEMGSVYEVNFLGISDHPMHIHVNPFQIHKLNDADLVEGASWGGWWEEGDWQDTLNLPVVAVDSAGAVLRLQPGEIPGVGMLHCHLMHHQDFGCMKPVIFTCPGQPQDANVNTGEACSNFSFPVKGTFGKRRGSRN